MAGGVNVTEQAAAKIKEMIAAENRAGQGLRLKVVGGGCSGLQYKLDFDLPKATDKVFEKDGGKSFGRYEKFALSQRHRAGL